MGLQDRDYSRNQGQGPGDLLRRLFFGDFYLGTVWDIRVRIHNSLVLLIIFRLLFAGAGGINEALASVAILFGIVLLHEFGHCFAARSVGGRGDDVLLWPLGGLAFIDTPRRPWPSFVGTAGGPLVNVLICLVCALILRVTQGFWVIGNPLAPFLIAVGGEGGLAQMNSSFSYYLWWIYSTSLSLLLFNLLPIFPLDGGRLFQCAMWPKLGFYASLNIACLVGMGFSGFLGISALASGSLFMAFLMLSCFLTCLQTRANLRALADEVWEEERYGGGNYSGNSHPDRARIGLPRVQFGKKPKNARPLDDRFSIRDLNPFEMLAKRRRRKQFERLMKDD